MGRFRAVPVALLFLLAFTGCGNFFQCQKASCPAAVSTGTGTGTGSTPAVAGGDYAYVASSPTGPTVLAEYSVGNNALTPLGMLDVGYPPVALAVTPNNGFLYAATPPGYTSPGVYGYSINASTGVLTPYNNGQVLATDQVAAMAISPDGGWLFTVNVSGLTMTEYKIGSTGALTNSGTLNLTGLGCLLVVASPTSQACSVTVAQSGNYVVASLGTSGDLVYPFNSAQGITGSGVTSISSGFSTSNPTGDYSVAVNSSNYAYIGQTNAVAAYTLSTSAQSVTTATNNGVVPYASGTTPRSLVLNPAGTFLYTANEGASTLSGFSVVNGGGLTAVSGSPVAGPTNVSAISVDNTGGYLVAVGYDGTAGVRLYTVSSTGALTQVAQTGSGTNESYPALIAMTH